MTGAIIGCGRIVQDHHVPAWQALGRAAVSDWTIADPTSESRYAVQMALGVPAQHAYSDYRALLLRERPDFAVVNSPHVSHETIVIDCLRVGVPVLVEKPMAATLSAARRMIAVSEAEGVPLGVIHNYRSRPQSELARKLLADGAVGRPFLYRTESLGMGWHPGAAGYDADWRIRRAAAGGGCLLDNGYHGVYLSQDFCGTVESVFARIGALRPGVEVEDTALLLVTHEGGATTSLQAAWSLGGESAAVNEIYGDEGTMRFEPDGTVAISRGSGHWDRHHAAPDAGFQAVFKRFLECVQGHGVPCTTANEGLECLRVIRAAYASAQRGVPVRLADFEE
ncbi:MAG TPA: Gfo/Idh/MocA family oxidoreductase [Armatimonadota bacterium]